MVDAVIAQLTDPHLEADPDGDSARALARAVAAIRRLDPAPDAVLLTGDLTADGRPAEYALLRQLIASLPAPAHPIPGNHDDRDALRSAFADDPLVTSSPGHVSYTAACAGVRALMLDTIVPGEERGALGPGRLAWLEAQLRDLGDGPAILAMHHPPILTGMPAFDAIGLPEADRGSLEALLRGAPAVRLVVAGHVHRSVSGAIAGRPVFVCPSVHLQARLDLRSPEAIVLVPDPPGFGIHLLTPDGPASHVEPVMVAGVS